MLYGKPTKSNEKHFTFLKGLLFIRNSRTILNITNPSYLVRKKWQWESQNLSWPTDSTIRALSVSLSLAVLLIFTFMRIYARMYTYA